MHERNHQLLDIKIRQYLLPTVMMKLALQLGNVVDAMLVGNLLGADAMAAVSLSMPALSLIRIFPWERGSDRLRHPAWQKAEERSLSGLYGNIYHYGAIRASIPFVFIFRGRAHSPPSLRRRHP